MREDDRVFLLGEDIGVFGGAFGVTTGLARRVRRGARDGHADRRGGIRRCGDRCCVDGRAPRGRAAVRRLHHLRLRSHRHRRRQDPLALGSEHPPHDPLPDGRRRSRRAVSRRLARRLVRRHGGPEDRLPRHRRGRVWASQGRDRGSRSRPLLRAQAALPHAACRCPADDAPHADRPGGDRPDRGRCNRCHLRLRGLDGARGRGARRRRCRDRRPAHDLAAGRADDPLLDREDVARARAPGGVSLDRCRRGDPVA